METGPLNFVTLSHRDFNNQRVKPDENLYFVHEQYVDDKGEVKTKIVLYKGKIPIGLVDKGRDGLSVFRTALSLGDDTVVVDQSDIETDGRVLQVGDMFIDSSADNWLYRVTATPGTQAHAKRIAPVRGEKGDKGDTGATPSITMAATVGNTTGTPSVSVTKGGTDENPTFGFAFHNLKGEKGDTGAVGATPGITMLASVDDGVGTPSVKVTTTGTDEFPNFTLAFKNLKGDKGDNGVDGEDGKTPSITLTAAVDGSVGEPAVEVTKGGTDENPTFSLAFSGLKGEKGDTGDFNMNTLYTDILIGNVNADYTLSPGFNLKADLDRISYTTSRVTLNAGIVFLGKNISYIFIKKSDTIEHIVLSEEATGWHLFLSKAAKNAIGQRIESDYGLFTISWLSRLIIVDFKEI